MVLGNSVTRLKAVGMSRACKTQTLHPWKLSSRASHLQPVDCIYCIGAPTSHLFWEAYPLKSLDSLWASRMAAARILSRMLLFASAHLRASGAASGFFFSFFLVLR
jgi:hypothetical protein